MAGGGAELEKKLELEQEVEEEMVEKGLRKEREVVCVE